MNRFPNMAEEITQVELTDIGADLPTMGKVSLTIQLPISLSSIGIYLEKEKTLCCLSITIVRLYNIFFHNICRKNRGHCS